MSDELYIGAMDCSHLIEGVQLCYYREEPEKLATLSIDLAPSEELRLLLWVFLPRVSVSFKRDGITIAFWQLSVCSERDNGKGWWITG